MIDNSNVDNDDDDSLITNDEDNDSCLHIADLLLLIDKNEKLIVDMSTMSSWNNSRQCYLTLHVFRNDTILNDDGNRDYNDDEDYIHIVHCCMSCSNHIKVAALS